MLRYSVDITCYSGLHFERLAYRFRKCNSRKECMDLNQQLYLAIQKSSELLTRQQEQQLMEGLRGANRNTVN